jgi:hypothetical protein
MAERYAKAASRHTGLYSPLLATLDRTQRRLLLLRCAGHERDWMRGPADAQQDSDMSYSGRRTGIPSYQ